MSCSDPNPLVLWLRFCPILRVDSIFFLTTFPYCFIPGLSVIDQRFEEVPALLILSILTHTAVPTNLQYRALSRLEGTFVFSKRAIF